MATIDFQALGDLLISLGLQESSEKSCSPSPLMICLLLQVDTNNLTLSVSSKRLCETEQLLKQWFTKRTATKSVYRGQISVRLNCVRQSRAFIVGILALFGKLRNNHHHVSLTAEFQREFGGADSCGSIMAYL